MNVSEAPTFDRNVMSIHDSRKDTNKDEESSVTRCEIDLLIRETGSTKFGEVQHLVSTSLGRCINYSERRVISDSLRASYCAAAERKRLELDEGHRGILILTAYSTDYTIGKLCDTINKQYADKHGYQYLSETLSYDEMMQAIGPDKKHCTWYKVLMLKRLLVEQAESLSKDKIQYLVWIDADAVVIDDQIRLEDIIERGGNRDLIIAENMHSGCLVNAGVMLVRVSEWSKQLWTEVWECNKYDNVTFYEQSALLQRLRAKREGLEMTSDRENQPFHSYLPGSFKGTKLFAHVSVLTHLELNTNSGWLCEGRQIERGRARRIQRSRSRLPSAKNAPNTVSENTEITEITELDALAEPAGYTSLAGEHYTSEAAFFSSEKSIFEAYLQGMQLPHFIFHAAGHCGKLESLKGVLHRKNIEIPEDCISLMDFKILKINRSSHDVAEGDA